MVIDKKQILHNLLKDIGYIADLKYQERVWIRAEGPEVDDFDETSCRFEDACEPILENYKEFGLTDNQYQVMIKLRDALDSLSIEKYPVQDFVRNPEWKNIVNLAQDVLKAFDYKAS